MENNRAEQAEKIVKKMEEDGWMSKIEDLVKENKIYFTHKNKEYRVRLLTMNEKDELDMLRRKKFGQLLQDKDILLEKDLIEQYKKRGIDIDEIDSEIKKFEAEETSIQMQLGEAIAKNESERVFDTYKKQIEELRVNKQIKLAQKTLLLEYSLENQLLNYVAQLITYLSLEYKNDNEKWMRLFLSIDDFKNAEDEDLINKAGAYTMFLQNC